MNNLIYTVLNTSTAVTDYVPVGSIIRKSGKCISASGSAITISKPGYYELGVSATFTNVAGEVTLAAQADGVDIPGATGTQTNAESSSVGSICFNSIIRVFCCKPVNIQILASGSPTITSMAIAVKEV